MLPVAKLDGYAPYKYDFEISKKFRNSRGQARVTA